MHGHNNSQLWLKRACWAALVLIILFLIVLVLLRSSPFSWFFTACLNGLGLSAIVCSISFGLLLFGKKSLPVKLLGSVPFLLGAVLLLLHFLLLIDYRILLPFTTTEISSEEYQEDLESFQRLYRTHPGFNSHIDSLSSKIFYRMKNQQIENAEELILEYTKLVGLFQDGHSFVLPMQFFSKSRYFPLMGFYFKEGFYVLNAAPSYSALINKKLIGVNSIPIDSIIMEIGRITGPENESNAKYRLPLYLFSSSTLRGLSATDHSEAAVFHYENTNGEPEEMVVESVPFINWAFWAFTPSEERMPVSLSLRKPNYDLKKDGRQLELILNLIEDIDDSRTIKELAIELDEKLRGDEIDQLVIDLRNNTGGNNQLYAPILDVIQKHPNINKVKKLFVFTSRTTFSAGINFLDDLMTTTNATMVGESPGAGATHYGDASMHFLLNSGIYFFLSTRQWKGNNPEDLSKFITPDIPVSYSFSEYKNGIDPWQEAIRTVH